MLLDSYFLFLSLQHLVISDSYLGYLLIRKAQGERGRVTVCGQEFSLVFLLKGTNVFVPEY